MSDPITAPATAVDGTLRAIAGRQREPGRQRDPEGAAPRPVRGGVPPRNPEFVVREHLLNQIRDRIVAGPTVLLPHVSHSLGGIGKTQLAVEYAHRFGDEYDLVWWVAAEQIAPLRASLAALARVLRIRESNDVNRTLAAVREALGRGVPYRRWLLVFDNANRPEDLAPYLPGGDGHVLITSRNPRWTAAQTVDVGVFSRSQSVRFLRTRGYQISGTDAHRLAKRLGDVPMALEQAAALQSTTQLSVDEYLAQYDERRRDLVGDAPAGDSPSPIVVTWSLALDGLRKVDPSAMRILELFAFLACEPVSWELLWAGRGAALPPELADTLKIKRKLGGAIRRIGQFGLAQVDAALETMQLHRLVQVLLLGQLSAEDHARYGRAAHDLLAAADPGDPDNPRSWPRYQAIAPHLFYANVLTGETDEARQLVLHHIRFLYACGDYDSSRDLASQAVQRWTRTLGEGDEHTLTAAYHLGNVLRAAGEADAARRLNERTLTRLRQLAGEDDDNALATANSVGADLRLRGLFMAARELDEDNLTRHRRLFGDAYPATLRCANNLAVDLRLLGDFAAARELDELTLAHRRRLFAGPHPETLSSISSLSLDWYGLGEYAVARGILEDSLEPHKATLGEDHPVVLLAARHYAMTLRKSGTLAAARAVADDNLAHYRRKFGDQNSDTLAAMVTLGNCLRAVADAPAALALIRQALDGYRALLGETHPFALLCAVDLAIALRATRRHAEALEVDRATHEALVDCLGAHHPFTLSCATGLASDLVLAGSPREALALSAETYAASRAARPPYHPYTLFCAHNHALDLIATGDGEAGRKLANATLHQLTGALGGRHPDALAAAAEVRLECDIEPPPT
jgi:hypothetical protein